MENSSEVQKTTNVGNGVLAEVSNSVIMKTNLINALSDVMKTTKGNNNHYDLEVFCRNKILELAKSIKF